MAQQQEVDPPDLEFVDEVPDLEMPDMSLLNYMPSTATANAAANKKKETKHDYQGITPIPSTLQQLFGTPTDCNTVVDNIVDSEFQQQILQGIVGDNAQDNDESDYKKMVKQGLLAAEYTRVALSEMMTGIDIITMMQKINQMQSRMKLIIHTYLPEVMMDNNVLLEEMVANMYASKQAKVQTTDELKSNEKIRAEIDIAIAEVNLVMMRLCVI